MLTLTSSDDHTLRAVRPWPRLGSTEDDASSQRPQLHDQSVRMQLACSSRCRHFSAASPSHQQGPWIASPAAQAQLVALQPAKPPPLRAQCTQPTDGVPQSRGLSLNAQRSHLSEHMASSWWIARAQPSAQWPFSLRRNATGSAAAEDELTHLFFNRVLQSPAIQLASFACQILLWSWKLASEGAVHSAFHTDGLGRLALRALSLFLHPFSAMLAHLPSQLRFSGCFWGRAQRTATAEPHVRTDLLPTEEPLWHSRWLRIHQSLVSFSVECWLEVFLFVPSLLLLLSFEEYLQAETKKNAIKKMFMSISIHDR